MDSGNLILKTAGNFMKKYAIKTVNPSSFRIPSGFRNRFITAIKLSGSLKPVRMKSPVLSGK
jgi:hypothetical protein